MKLATSYILAPLVLLGIIFTLLLMRFLPNGIRSRLLAISAALISFLPANCAGGQVRCYDSVPISQTDQNSTNVTAPAGVTNTPEWISYQKSYITLLDFIAISKYDEDKYTKLLSEFVASEDALNKLVEGKKIKKNVAKALNDGMQGTADSYIRDTCYKVRMTPKMERKLDLSSVVRRQIELRKMFLANEPMNFETVKQIKESMFNDVKKYFTTEELEEYKKLMIQLTDVPDY